MEKRLFVSIDVTFQELEPYYSSEAISPFGDSFDTKGMRRERQSSDSEIRMMIVSGVSYKEGFG
jgi:hypothetical protein